MSSILFTNVDILIRDSQKYNTIHGYLGVEGNVIDYIGNEKPNKGYDIIKDYSGKLLMPGLINCHTHCPMVFMRGKGSGLNLQQWLFDTIFPIEDKMTADIVNKSSKFALLEMIASGTTSFTDMYFFPEETAEAVKESGMKANICKYITCFDENMKVEDSLIPASIEFFKQFNGYGDGRVIVDFGIHGEYTNKAHIVKAYSEFAKQYHANINIHLSETFSETQQCFDRYGLTPTQWFESLGTFDSPVTTAHCVAVTDQDMDILKKHNVTVAHNPTSNMKLGSGFAPVKKMLEKGINVTLGTDGAASNNNLNMFEEIHVASLISNGYNYDPTEISATELIDMATINGAIAQGRKDTGKIQVGYKADIIAIDMNKPHLMPNFDSEILLVSSVQGSDVCMNMVDGSILYENGNYFTLDKEKITDDFLEVVNEFYK